MLQPGGDWYSSLPKSPDSNVQGEVLLMTPDSLLVLITENNAQASRFQRHLSEELGLPILLVGS